MFDAYAVMIILLIVAFYLGYDDHNKGKPLI